MTSYERCMGNQAPKLRYLDRSLSKARNVYFTLLVEDEKSDGANTFQLTLLKNMQQLKVCSIFYLE